MDELRPADAPLEGLVEATLAAAGLDDLGGASPRAIAARRAMVEIVGDRLDADELSALLNVHRRTLFRLKKRAVDHKLVRAIRLQLGARADLAANFRQWNNGNSA